MSKATVNLSGALSTRCGVIQNTTGNQLMFAANLDDALKRINKRGRTIRHIEFVMIPNLENWPFTSFIIHDRDVPDHLMEHNANDQFMKKLTLLPPIEEDGRDGEA